MIRLDRYLATLGVGSRSQVQKLIRQGAARVDGVPVRDPGFACREGADLTVNGEMLDIANWLEVGSGTEYGARIIAETNEFIASMDTSPWDGHIERTKWYKRINILIIKYI